MAFIGLRYPVVATLSSHTDGSEPTYGTGKVIGHAITANLTITRNDNPLYADDRIVEDDNGITAMSLELGVDDLTEEIQAYMLGTIKETTGSGTSAVDTYLDSDASAPDVGMGYIRVRRKAGVTSYQACWIYKAKFSFEDESTQTKGESIEWQTPTVTGRCVGISRGSTGRIDFRARQVFASEAEAKAWLNTKANIATPTP